MKHRNYLIVSLAFIILPTCFMTLQSLNAQEKKVFRAGAATSNITPFLGGGLVGNFGTPPPATNVHDELHAKCLVLDDGSTKLVFAIVDIIGMNRDLIDEIKSIVNDETGIPKGNILISAIHTHSATSVQGDGEKRRKYTDGEPFDEYQRFFIRKVADGIRIADNNLEPARIGWGVGSVPQHVFVRRWKMKPGTVNPNPFGGTDQVVMNPGVGNPNLLEPAGKTDPQVFFISVQSIKGRPIALLGNYSLHYVGGTPKGDISADYFAVFGDRIQDLLKADRQHPPFVGIMSNGTSGNVNNINFRGPSEKREPYEKINIVANDVANEVFRVYQTIKYHDYVTLKSAQKELVLKVRKPDQKMIQYANMILAKPETEKPYHRNEKDYAERTILIQDWPEVVNVVLQVFRIGDLGVAAIPFETFTETGLALKEKSPLKPSFTIELANGSYGYLPTPEQHKLGGYETWLGTNRVEIEASDKILSTLLDLFESVK
jgi:neutral ceramidase